MIRTPVRTTVWGVCLAVLLVVAAISIPVLTGWDVRVRSLPPLYGEWQPRLGIGTLPALVCAGLVGIWGPVAVSHLRWSTLLIGAFVVSAAWMLSLDAIDGTDHLGTVLDTEPEYLHTARAIAAAGLSDSVPDLLRSYVSRIPFAAADNLPVHLAGHPPGMVIVFALLIAAGVSTTWSIGLVITLIAATIPLAVLVALRSLGAETAARATAPFLALAPAAIWLAVSADAVIAAVAAWSIAALCLAVSRREDSQCSGRAWSITAGVGCGIGTYLNYGFPLLGCLVIAVLICSPRLRVIPWFTAGGLLVTAAFTVGGFSWWEAYPVLQKRYWDGIAAVRPPEYWMWANLAALTIALGPAAGAGIAAAVRTSWTCLRHSADSLRRLPRWARVALGLSGAAVVMVLIADLSNLSRAEVERIWLFIMPWLLVSLALVPPRSRAWLLRLNLLWGICAAHLVYSAW